MPKYKLNMVVDAWQFDGTPQSGVAIEEVTGGIATLHRTMPGAEWIIIIGHFEPAKAGDWIVQHDSEYYTVTDDNFKARYTPVKDTKVKD